MMDCDRFVNDGSEKECYEPVFEFLEFNKQYKFWVRGIVILVIGIFGFAGNFLTIVVLRMKSQVKMTFPSITFSTTSSDPPIKCHTPNTPAAVIGICFEIL